MASIQQVTVPAQQVANSGASTAVQFYDWKTGTWKQMPGLRSLADAAAQGFISLGQGIYWKYTSHGGGGAGIGAEWINLRETTPSGGSISGFGTAMASSPNLDVTFDAWGSPIPLMEGHVRIMGKMIWGNGLETGTSVASPAFLSFAIGFGYPLDPLEWQWIECVKLWANGIKIFGGPDDLPGLTFTFYEGKEDAPIDPLILADKGVARTPAFRGLRYIVFNQFPLSVVGNSLPMISAEFNLTKAAPAPFIFISDVLKQISAKANVTLSTESNFDDLAPGVVFMSDVAPVALMRDQSPTYNYMILDGNGASVSRRKIGSDLVIDITIDVDDMITESPTEPAITFERAEQSEIANQIAIQYTDVDLAFTNGVQYARRPIFPIREALSDKRDNVQLPYSLFADQVILLAYDQLYRGWTEQLTVKFKSKNVLIEVGDVIYIQGHELGNFIVRVSASNLRFDTAVVNEISALALLKSSGVIAVADSGDYISDTILAALNYPDIIFTDTSLVIPNVQWGQVLITDGAIVTFSIGRGSEFGFMFAPVSVPSKVSHTNFVAYKGASPPIPQDTGQILEDASYVYIADFGTSGIQRISKTNISDTTYLDLSASTGNLAQNGNQFAINGGYMYWGDRAQGASGDMVKVYRLDLSLFSVAGLHVLPLNTDTSTFICIGCVAVGASLLLTVFNSNNVGASDSRIYKVSLTDPTFSTYGYVAITNGPGAGLGYLGRGVSDGVHAYFLPMESDDGVVSNWDDAGADKANPLHFGAKIDPVSLSSSGGITWFNVTDDASVSFTSKGNVFPWLDSTNLYFLANDVHAAPFTQFLAARNLGTLAVVTGFDLTSIYDDTKFDFLHGASDGKSHYITGLNIVDNLGAMIKVEQDLSSGELFYRGNAGVPANDDFANAAPISLNTTVTTSNILATRQVGEPLIAGNAGGASIWYAFTAAASGTVTVDASTSVIDVLIGVYTGTAVGSLTLVADNAFGTVSFTAVSGTRYMIALDGFDGVSNTIKFTIS